MSEHNNVEVFTFVHGTRTVHLFCTCEEDAVRAFEAFIPWWKGPGGSPCFGCWLVVDNPGFFHTSSVFAADGCYRRVFNNVSAAIGYVLEQLEAGEFTQNAAANTLQSAPR